MSLVARNVCLGYAKKAIITDLSVSVPVGKVTALIGPNGCGKSTLLRGCAGLLQPQSGELRLNDSPISSWPRRALALKLAHLPQKPSAPDGILVEHLVCFGRFPYQGLWKGHSAEDQAIVRWAMERTGVAAYADKPVAALSGGEQQRVWIAMAIAQQAEILILDEPTTYLDWGHQLEILELLRELNREGLTVVMSLHDLNQAAQFSDHILAMRDGRLIGQGEPSQVINRELLHRVFQVDARVEIQANGKPYCIAKGTAANTDVQGSV